MNNASITPDSPRHAGAGKWFVVILLSVIATCLLIELGSGADMALAEPSVSASGAAGEVIAVSAQITSDSYGVYLLNPKRGTIAVYQFQPKSRRLRLMAVRNYSYDVQLDEYNTEPSPREIKQLVGQQQRLGETQ